MPSWLYSREYKGRNAVEATLADACSNDINEEVELDCRVEGGSGV